MSTKEATALHASNHVLADAQQPKIHYNCIGEGFQLITRLLSLLSLQQGCLRGLLHLPPHQSSWHATPRPAYALHMSGEVHNKYSRYSLCIVLRAGDLQIHVCRYLLSYIDSPHERLSRLAGKRSSRTR
jgi:hypothetical protein